MLRRKTTRDDSYDLWPELRLWASVLERAVLDFLEGKDLVMGEAAEWIFDVNTNIEFNTFENICYSLDLDPDAIRDRLKKMNSVMYKKYSDAKLTHHIVWLN